MILQEVNVLEDESFALHCASQYRKYADLGIPLVSRLRTIRQSLFYSFLARSGLTEGLRILR